MTYIYLLQDRDPITLIQPDKSESSMTPSPPGGAVIHKRESEEEWTGHSRPSMDSILTSVNGNRTKPNRHRHARNKSNTEWQANQIVIDRTENKSQSTKIRSKIKPKAKPLGNRPTSKPPLPPTKALPGVMHEQKVEYIEKKKRQQQYDYNNNGSNDSHKPHVPRSRPPPLGHRNVSNEPPNRPLPQLNSSANSSDDEYRYKHRPKKPIPQGPAPSRPGQQSGHLTKSRTQHSTPISVQTIMKDQDATNFQYKKQLNEIVAPVLQGMERGHSTPYHPLSPPRNQIPVERHYKNNNNDSNKETIETQNNFPYKKKRNVSQNSSCSSDDPSLNNNLQDDYFNNEEVNNHLIDALGQNKVVGSVPVSSHALAAQQAYTPSGTGQQGQAAHLATINDNDNENDDSSSKKRKKNTMNDVSISRGNARKHKQYNSNVASANISTSTIKKRGNNNRTNHNHNNLQGHRESRPSRVRSRSLTSLSSKNIVQEANAVKLIDLIF